MFRNRKGYIMIGKYKTLFILSIISIFFVVALLFWFSQPKSPLKALEKRYTNQVEGIRYKEMIQQIDVDSKCSLLFYMNSNGNVNCAVSYKEMVGYKIIADFSELSSYDDTVRVGLLGGKYKFKQQNKWVYYGIIHDSSVNKVIWGNTEAIKFHTKDFKMVYAVGDGDFRAGEYEIYDSNGNKMDYWIADVRNFK